MQIGVEAQRAVENRRVFVVDADEINRTALQFMLADDNETHEFATLATALEKGQQWPPDLFLIGEPLLADQGKALVARLRATWPGVKVLAICASDAAACVASAKAAGVDESVSRPFKMEAVRRKVDRHLGRKVELRIPVVVT